MKPSLRIDVLAGQERNIDVLVDLLQQIGVLPGDHVFEPRDIVFLQRLAQPDAGVDADVAEVVRGKRDIHADLFAHRGHEVGHQLRALVR